MTKKKLPTNSPLKSKRSYTLRELPLKQQHNVRKFLLELQDKADDLEALKKPGELWYFSLFGNRSRLYETLELAIPHLNEWAMSAQQRSHGSNSPDDVIQGIKILKFKGTGVKVDKELSDTDFEKTTSEFAAMRRKVREEVRAKKVAVREEALEKLGTKRKGQMNRSLTSTDLLQNAMKKLEKAAKQMAAMQKKLDAMAKKVTPKKGKVSNGRKKNSGGKTSSGGNSKGSASKRVSQTKSVSKQGKQKVGGKSAKKKGSTSNSTKPKGKAKSKRKTGR